MGQRIPSGNKYDLLRQKAQQSVKAGEQEQQDAISRRYASLGMGGSGAAIKTQRDIQDKAQQNIQGANEAIGFQEAAEQEQRAQIEADRAFQRGEREAGQKFASGETALQRKFAAEEAAKARDLQAGQFEKQFGLQKRQMTVQQAQFLKQLNLARDQFDLERQVTAANLDTQTLEKLNKFGVKDYAGWQERERKSIEAQAARERALRTAPRGMSAGSQVTGMGNYGDNGNYLGG